MQDQIPEESTPVPVDFADAFDEWLGGATIAQRSVVIYAKPGLYGRWQELDRQREFIEKRAEGGDESLGDDELTKVLKDLEDVYNEWMASKSTWYLQALTPSEIEALKDQTPTFKDLDDDASAQDQSDLDKMREAAQDEENLRSISKAVLKVEFGDGRTVDGVTVEQLETMQDKLGMRQMMVLLGAAFQATLEEPEIPAPFSQRISKTDQT